MSMWKWVNVSVSSHDVMPCSYLALGEDGVVHVQLPRLVHRHDLAAGEEDDLIGVGRVEWVGCGWRGQYVRVRVDWVAGGGVSACI